MRKKRVYGLVYAFATLTLASLISGCGSTGVSSTAQSTTNNPPPAGSLSANEGAVQFGNVPLGASATQTLVFTNSSTSSPVAISSLQVTGSGFSLNQSPSLPTTVAAGQSISVSLQVQPSAAGAMSGTLTAVSDGNPSTITINLSATGVVTTGTTFSISGTISPVAGSASATVTLTGAGITSSTVTVDSNGNFTFLGLSNGSYTVTPSKSGIGFNPSTQQVTVNAANVAGVNFTELFAISGSLSSSGSGATVALSGAASQQTVADASGNYTFTGLASGTYTVTPKKNGYSFSPANSQVTVGAANVGSLSFTVVPGQLSISPSAFTFSNVALGSTSQSQSATLTAVGGDVSITTDTLTGAGFGISGISFPVTILSGNNVGFSLSFTPSNAGTTSGSISFSNGQSTLGTAQLSGTGIGLAVSPGTVSFGQLLDGTSSSGQSVTLSAIGASITVNSANLVQSGGGGSAFSVTGLPTVPFTLPSGQTTQFTLTFSPAAGSPGNASASLTFASSTNTVVVSASGIGDPNVLLSWNASSTPSVTYKVYRCSISATACTQSQPGNFTNIASGIATLGYTDSSVSSGQTYYYAVTAVDQTNTESALSTISNSASVP